MDSAASRLPCRDLRVVDLVSRRGILPITAIDRRTIDRIHDDSEGRCGRPGGTRGRHWTRERRQTQPARRLIRDERRRVVGAAVPQPAVHRHRSRRHLEEQKLIYAGAKHVTVRLTRADGMVSLAVSDGSGFDRTRLGSAAALGLIMMRERATQLNGRFDVETTPGRGTTIRVAIPFR